LLCFAASRWVTIGCAGSSPSSPSSLSSPDTPLPCGDTPVTPPPCGGCPGGPNITFETVYEGCGLRASQLEPGLSWAIDNQEDLNSAWADYSLDGSAPTIDFCSHTLLATITPGYCAGCCPTSCEVCPAGYDAEIVAVIASAFPGGVFLVDVAVQQISPIITLDCTDTNARVHIVSIPNPGPSALLEFGVNVSVCPEP
jgi:hypothetical protein